jgi:hypothetical protein
MWKAKMTPWFSGKVNPARCGVYERKWSDGQHCFSRWDGMQWMWAKSSAQEAHDEKTPSSWRHHLQWRGLASNPKAKP